MIASVGIILLVFGFVCAVLAAISQPPVPAWARVHLGWAAVAFLLAAMIFGGLHL